MKRRGFFLTELLVVLIMLTVFGLVAGRLFHATVMLSYRQNDAQNAAASFDSAVNALRGDVWSAKSMEIDTAGMLRITRSDQSVLNWNVKTDSLSRSTGDRTDRWSVPAGVTLGIDGPSVVVNVPQRGQIRLNNQVTLLTKLLQ